jgi:hypothetical protein
MSDNDVMTTPIFDELLSKFGIDRMTIDDTPETPAVPVEKDEVHPG